MVDRSGGTATNLISYILELHSHSSTGLFIILTHSSHAYLTFHQTEGRHRNPQLPCNALSQRPTSRIDVVSNGTSHCTVQRRSSLYSYASVATRPSDHYISDLCLCIVFVYGEQCFLVYHWLDSILIVF